MSLAERAAENADELAALERLLRRSADFTLVFARVNQPARAARLRADLAARFAAGDVATVSLASDGGAVEQMELALPPDARPVGVFVCGFDALVDVGDGDGSRLDGLNLNRDHLARRFPYPVVFWVNDHALAQLAHRAPDLWSWKSEVLWFSGESDLATEGIAGTSWSSSVRDQLAEETALQAVFDELTQHSDATGRVVADVASRLADLVSRRGRYEDADGLYNLALPIYRQVGSRVGEANTLESVGQLRLKQGDFGRSRHAFQAAADLYEAIGNLYWANKCAGMAVTLAKQTGPGPTASTGPDAQGVR